MCAAGPGGNFWGCPGALSAAGGVCKGERVPWGFLMLCPLPGERGLRAGLARSQWGPAAWVPAKHHYLHIDTSPGTCLTALLKWAINRP